MSKNESASAVGQLSEAKDAAVSSITRAAAAVSSTLRSHPAPTGDTRPAGDRDAVVAKASVPLALQKDNFKSSAGGGDGARPTQSK
ncbi:hypothetical protein KFE25_012363 [Diacronema lutheri]|uniref:Uncharacterized protein n=1 Tax=Diacronema lutheri TaxID=2081491 RepID=A0A8J5XLG3_DIALT|nr:hypothetical protein KFE25_012363 [Diacronema lutheri]